MRQELLQMIGGLPEKKTDLRARITGKIQMGWVFHRKLIYRPAGSLRHRRLYIPPMIIPSNIRGVSTRGHATNGKIHYQD